MLLIFCITHKAIIASLVAAAGVAAAAAAEVSVAAAAVAMAAVATAAIAITPTDFNAISTQTFELFGLYFSL